MVKAILFMIKVGVLVAAAVWVAQRPGSVSIDWMEYTVHMHVGLFLGIAIVTILLAIFIFRVVKGVADFPKSLQRYNFYAKKDKGYRALTLGITAVAAGDASSASYQAQRTERFLPEDTGLPLLLKAQAARLRGEEDAARDIFLKLLENKDAAFLGVRGLLQAAVDHKDYTKALDLARRALELHPKQKWILRVVYDLEIRAKDWDAASKTLYRAQKAGAIEADKASSDRVAILVAQAQNDFDHEKRDDAFAKLKKAYQFDPYFAPVAVRLSGQYVQRGNRRRAVAIVEKCWKKSPHPDLVPVWDLLIPRKKAPDAASRLKWYEKLLSLKPGSIEARLAAAKAAMEEGLWGEARHHLTMAMQEAPEDEIIDARVYRLLAELEDRSTQNEEASMRWLDKAEESLMPRSWMCRLTGRVYSQWSPVAQPHGAFNTIIWEQPDRFEWNAYYLPGGAFADAYIEAPRN